MEKEKKGKHFIQKPIYEGGIKAMKNFIITHLQYPETALKKGIEGTVSLRYSVNHKGQVIKVKIISGIGYGCDEEAERLVKMLVFSKTRNRKRRITFNKTLQIHFRLPKEKVKHKVPPSTESPSPIETVTEIQYNYVSHSTSKNKQDQSEKGTSSSAYSYTINF